MLSAEDIMCLHSSAAPRQGACLASSCKKLFVLTSEATSAEAESEILDSDVHCQDVWPDDWSQGYLKQAAVASDVWGGSPSIYTCTLDSSSFYWGLACPCLLIELLCMFGFSNPGCSQSLEVRSVVSPHARKFKIFSPLTLGMGGGEGTPSSPAGLDVVGTRNHLLFPPAGPQRGAVSVFLLTGFIKPRNFEVGERISSFHKNLN